MQMPSRLHGASTNERPDLKQSVSGRAQPCEFAAELCSLSLPWWSAVLSQLRQLNRLDVSVELLQFMTHVGVEQTPSRLHGTSKHGEPALTHNTFGRLQRRGGWSDALYELLSLCV